MPWLLRITWLLAALVPNSAMFFLPQIFLVLLSSGNSGLLLGQDHSSQEGLILSIGFAQACPRDQTGAGVAGMNYDDNAKRIGRRVQAGTRQAIPRPHMTETLSRGSDRPENGSTEASIGCISQRADRIEAI